MNAYEIISKLLTSPPTEIEHQLLQHMLADRMKSMSEQEYNEFAEYLTKSFPMPVEQKDLILRAKKIAR